MTQFPIGGRELWDLRVSGKRPEDMVVVSLIGPRYTPNPLLWVGARVPDAAIARLEWRMLAGLDVEVHASAQTAPERVLAALAAILPHARDVFLYYPEPGFRIAVRWLDPALPIRVVDYDQTVGTVDSRQAAGVVSERMRAALSPYPDS